MKLKQYINEGKKDYNIYHNQYSSAATEIEDYAKKNGYALDDDSHPDNKGGQMFDEIGSGPRKPKDGVTNSFHFKLYKKDKVQRKQLHAQITGIGDRFELNMYIS